MKLRKLQIFSLFMFELSLFSWDDTYKIMINCPSCTYPSIHRFMRVVRRAHISKHSPFHGADSQDHGRLPVSDISKYSHNNLRTCWTPRSALQKKMELVLASLRWLFCDEKRDVTSVTVPKNGICNRTKNNSAGDFSP